MMTKEVPDTLVSETKRVMGTDGVWDRFAKAIETLNNTALELCFSKEYAAFRSTLKAGIGADNLQSIENARPDMTYRLQPHRAGHSVADIHELLFGHCGFNAEWANGGGTLRNVSAEYPEDMQDVVHVFRQPSQLAKHGGGKIPESELETKREALERVPVEMEALLAHNTDRISDADKARVEEQVAEYRAALADVLKYVDFVGKELGKTGQGQPAVGR